MELQDQETCKIVSKRPMESVYQFTSIKSIWGLPCWLKNKETCQCRRHGFNCWSKKIPHPTCRGTTKPECHNYWALLWSQGATAPEPRAATTEAHLPWSPVLCENRSHCSEKPTPQLESSPCSSQTRKKLVQQWRPSSQN